jgi:hypothetical protein
MLEKQGDDAAAEEWYRRSLESGHRHSARALAALLAKRGATAEAVEVLRSAVDGSPAWLVNQLEDDLERLTGTV